MDVSLKATESDLVEKFSMFTSCSFDFTSVPDSRPSRNHFGLGIPYIRKISFVALFGGELLTDFVSALFFPKDTIDPLHFLGEIGKCLPVLYNILQSFMSHYNCRQIDVVKCAINITYLYTSLFTEVKRL
jgi:hypothetical protein